jgi:hypothetical protein
LAFFSLSILLTASVTLGLVFVAPACPPQAGFSLGGWISLRATVRCIDQNPLQKITSAR